MPNEYYSPSTGPWLPRSRRRRRPRRWLRYPLAAAVIASTLWLGLPLVIGPQPEAVQVIQACPPRSALTWVRPFNTWEGYGHAR